MKKVFICIKKTYLKHDFSDSDRLIYLPLALLIPRSAKLVHFFQASHGKTEKKISNERRRRQHKAAPSRRRHVGDYAFLTFATRLLTRWNPCSASRTWAAWRSAGWSDDPWHYRRSSSSALPCGRGSASRTCSRSRASRPRCSPPRPWWRRFTIFPRLLRKITYTHRTNYHRI